MRCRRRSGHEWWGHSTWRVQVGLGQPADKVALVMRRRSYLLLAALLLLALACGEENGSDGSQ
jgi:hypothetical protein